MYQCTCRRWQRTWMGLKEAVAASLLSCLDLPTLRMMVQAGRQRTMLVNCKQLSKHLILKKGIHVHIECTCRRRQRTWMGLKEAGSRVCVALQKVWVKLQLWVELGNFFFGRTFDLISGAQFRFAHLRVHTLGIDL